MSFAIGQRWISHADLELGLGICVETDGRRTTLLYPSVDEERTYANDRAPLTRYLLKKNDELLHIDGGQFTVLDVEPVGETVRYSVRDTEGEIQSIHEQFIAPEVRLNTPADRLLNNQLDKPADFNLRFATLEQRASSMKNQHSGLLGARTSLLSHQLYVASTVGKRFAPRVLLADEVGLGKTIEAGLILSQQLKRGRVERVLIAVPDPLLHQWLVEMLRRFNLRFTVINEARWEASTEQEAFAEAPLAIVPWSLLQNHEDAALAAMESDWDLVIYDEAHHLNLGCEAKEPFDVVLTTIAKTSPGLLLLTATPGQAGIDSHFARLQLLDPDRFSDLEQFVSEQQHFTETYQLIEQLEAGVRPEGLPSHFEASWSNQRMIRELVDQYGTGRVLFRNTRESVKGFPERRLIPYPMEAETDEEDASVPARAVWLAELLKSLKQQKVLVICHDKQTAIDLEHYLHLRAGIRCASFHEDLSIIERDRAAAYFADTEYGAKALICSEIGSEGRNFQFAQHLVCYDLPAHPDLLEQRIGRLDRIGQVGDVQIHVPFVKDSAEESYFRWLHEGLNGFEEPSSVGHLLFEEFSSKLSTQPIDELIAETHAQRLALLATMQSGRDRLLEITSHDPEAGQKLMDAIDDAMRVDDLGSFSERLFDRLGVYSENGDDSTVILKPSENLVTGELPFLDEDGITCTFDRQVALSRDDIQFLTWEHPLIEELINVVFHSELGNASLGVIKQKSITPGTVLVETLHTVECLAPKRLELARFLDQSPIRQLRTLEGRDITHAISCDNLSKIMRPVEITKSATVIRELRDKVVAALKLSDRSADTTADARKQSAIDTATSQLGEELDRIRALAERNAGIRSDEIEALTERTTATAEALTRADALLQGVRLVIAT